MKTCTAADYSIRVDLKDEWYEAFLSQNQGKTNDKKLSIENKLQSDIVNALNTKEEVLHDIELEEEKEIAVADVRFGYKNRRLINMMLKRGAQLGADKPKEQVNDTDEQINALINDHGDKLQIPVCAFVTFTTQEAKERAMKYFCKFNEDGTDNLDYEAFSSSGFELKVTDAPEPSNIIWENLEVSSFYQKANFSVVVVIITAALVAVFFLFLWLKVKAG